VSNTTNTIYRYKQHIMQMKLRESIFTKQIETDRSVQTVWCEYAWKMSVNSKGSTLSYLRPNDGKDQSLYFINFITK